MLWNMLVSPLMELVGVFMDGIFGKLFHKATNSRKKKTVDLPQRAEQETTSSGDCNSR
jgi:hypothetical protein